MNVNVCECMRAAYVCTYILCQFLAGTFARFYPVDFAWIFHFVAIFFFLAFLFEEAKNDDIFAANKMYKHQMLMLYTVKAH